VNRHATPPGYSRRTQPSPGSREPHELGHHTPKGAPGPSASRYAHPPAPTADPRPRTGNGRSYQAATHPVHQARPSCQSTHRIPHRRRVVRGRDNGPLSRPGPCLPYCSASGLVQVVPGEQLRVLRSQSGALRRLSRCVLRSPPGACS
jgi:hypothetical protein